MSGTKKDPVTKLEGPRGNKPGTKHQGEAAKEAQRVTLRGWMERDSPTTQRSRSGGGEGEGVRRGGGGGEMHVQSVATEKDKEMKGK